MQVDSAANSAIAPHRPETEAKHIFMMGPDPNRSKNFNGIYISPESHQKRVITKKKSTPGGTSVDLRFKMKDLEYASNMSSDDFFLAGTASKTCSQKSTERPPQEESVEDKVSQQEVDSVIPLQAQGDAILKRQKLNGQAYAKRFVMRERSSKPLYKRPHIFVEDVQFPLISQA